MKLCMSPSESGYEPGGNGKVAYFLLQVSNASNRYNVVNPQLRWCVEQKIGVSNPGWAGQRWNAFKERGRTVLSIPFVSVKYRPFHKEELNETI